LPAVHAEHLREEQGRSYNSERELVLGGGQQPELRSEVFTIPTTYAAPHQAAVNTPRDPENLRTLTHFMLWLSRMAG